MKPKLTELASEQKRILCAEACGFRISTDSGIKHVPITLHYPDAESFSYFSDMHILTMSLPHYDTSLDAMAEAEATFSESSYQCVAYLDALVEVIRRYVPDPQSNADAIFLAVTATASQRLDAFLLAKGLAE